MFLTDALAFFFRNFSERVFANSRTIKSRKKMSQSWPHPLVKMALCCLVQLLAHCRPCDGASELSGYRLINGNASAGLLQVYSQSNLQWGTVCGTFDDVAATVACKSIGFNAFVGRLVPSSPTFGIGYGLIQLGNVNCVSTTLASLASCTYNSNSQQNIVCDHSSDVSISCGLPEQPGWSFKLRSDNVLLFRTPSTAAWGPVCYTAPDSFLAPIKYDIISAACRSLDPYLYGRYYGWSKTMSLGNESYTSSLQAVQCNPSGNVTLDRCVTNVTGSVAQCSEGFLQLTSCALRVYSVRLGNMSDAFTGRLEVKPAAEGFAWGAVCNRSIALMDPTALCRQAGRAGTIGSFVQRPSGHGILGASIPMFNYTCPTAAAPSCTFALVSQADDCAHDKEVFLRCNLPVTRNASLWQFRQVYLSTGDPFVLVRPNASAPWGMVCPFALDTLGNDDGMAACRSFGLPYVTNALPLTASASGSAGLMPVYMDGLLCDAKARNLTQCAFTVPVAASPSTCTYKLTVRCTYPDAFTYQLTSGSTSARSEYGGLLEILQSGSNYASGNVCDDGSFSADNATFVCQRLFGVTRVGVLTKRFGKSYLNRTLLSQLNCNTTTGFTLGFTSCTMMAQPEPSCENVVGLDCVLLPSPINQLSVSVFGPSPPTIGFQVVLMKGFSASSAAGPWLPICADYFTDVSQFTATLICNQLGYPSESAALGLVYDDPGSTLAGMQRYRASGSLVCSAGSSSPSTLQDCVSSLSDMLMTRSQCLGVRTISCPSTRSYFISGPSATQGLLLQLSAPPSTSSTAAPARRVAATVCGSAAQFGNNTANAACEAVGLPGHIGSFRSVGAGGSGFGIASPVACPVFYPSSARTLPLCGSSLPSAGSNNTNSCTHNNDVGLYCAVPAPMPQSNLQVMLDAQNVVLVRKSPQDLWGGVCYTTLDTRANQNAFARAVCASVGLGNMSSRVAFLYTNTAAVGTGGDTLHNVACADIYNITNLGQCLFTTLNATATYVTSISSSYVATATCANFAQVFCDTTRWEYGLFNGVGPLSGVVGVRPTSYAPWGRLFMRTTGASDVTTDSFVASYLCNASGLRGYEGTLLPSDDAPTAIDDGPLYLANFTCSTSTSCTYNVTSSTSSVDSSDSLMKRIWVACKKPQPRNDWAYMLPGYGSQTASPLMVKPGGISSPLPWGYIGRSSFVNLSMVACLSVVPGTPTNVISTWTRMVSGVVYLADVWSCIDDPQSLGDCLGNTSQYSISSSLDPVVVLSLACYYGSSLWKYRLVTAPSSSGATSAADVIGGRLEVRPTEETSLSSWGTVCNVGFQPSASLCSIVGRVKGYVAQRQSIERYGQGSGNIYMSNLSCGNVASIGNCNYANQSSTMAANKSSSSLCSHDQDLGIACVVPEARADWLYEPVSGCDPIMSYCGVVARQQQQQQGGSSNSGPTRVCPAPVNYLTDSQFSYFSDASASALCRSFGLVYGFQGGISSMTGSASGAGVALSCAPNVTNAQQCLQIPVDTCSTYVTVKCGDGNWTYGLVNARNSTTSSSSSSSGGGAVVVGTLVASSPFLDGAGGVCFSGFDAAVATMACSSIGLAGTTGKVNAVPLAAATGTTLVHVASINCSDSVLRNRSNSLFVAPSLTQCVAQRPIPGQLATTCTTIVELECSMPPLQVVTTWMMQPTTTPLSQSYAATPIYIRPNTSAAWGVVCGTELSPQAGQVICGELFPAYSAQMWRGSAVKLALYSFLAPPTFPIYGVSVACPGNTTTSLSECSVVPSLIATSPQPTSSWSCQYTLGVSCTLRMQRFEFRLRRFPTPFVASPSSQQSAPTSGVVEMRPKYPSGLPWGTLCSSASGLPLFMLDTYCSLLGFPGSSGALTACPADTAAQSFGMPIYAQPLFQCTSPDNCDATPPTMDGGLPTALSASCTHSNDTCVTCIALPGTATVTPATPPAQPDGRLVSAGGGGGSASWQVALHDTIVNGSQLLFVRPSASVAWGHVCNGSTFQAREAAMFCHWMGCTDNCRSIVGTRQLGSLHGPVHVSQVRCPAGTSSATDITQCSYWEYLNGTSMCAETDAVTLRCIPPFRPTVSPVASGISNATIVANNAALFLLSSSTTSSSSSSSSSAGASQVTATTLLLSKAIFAAFGVAVNTSSISTPIGDGTSAGDVVVMVTFPSTAKRDEVVSASNDVNSLFSLQYPFVYGASYVTPAGPPTTTTTTTSTTPATTPRNTVPSSTIEGPPMVVSTTTTSAPNIIEATAHPTPPPSTPNITIPLDGTPPQSPLPTTAPPPSTDPPAMNASDDNTGAIVGGAVGGVALLAVIGGAVAYRCTRPSKVQKDQEDPSKGGSQPPISPPRNYSGNPPINPPMNPSTTTEERWPQPVEDEFDLL